MQQPIETLVKETLAKLADCDVGTISPTTKPEELGIESVKLVEAVFLFEDALDISIPFSQTDSETQFDTSQVGTIVDSLEKLVQAKN